MSESSLKSKTVNGLGWSVVDNVTRMGVSFFVSIVLARLLSPDEYGLIGILLIFINVSNALVDSGFSSALIRKQNATDTDYSTIFYINLLVSLALVLSLYVGAPLIADFFKREELTALTRVMSFLVLINALSLVQRTIMTKRVDFKTQTKVTFFSAILSGIIGIYMAYAGYGVWALVGQQISNQLCSTICFFIFNHWFPKLVFSRESFTEMWSFGWKLLISGLIDTTWKEVHQVVVGKCYSPATLGLYTRANQFSQLFSSNLTQIIQRVSYPVLSSIQDDKNRLREAYRRVVKTTMLPTFVLMLGMAAVARPLILCLIGEKWLGCVGFLQIICIYGALYPLHAINLNMLQVQGRSDLFLKLEIIKKCISVGPLLLGIFVDIYLMLLASFVVSCISYYLNAYYSGPFINYSIKQQIKDIIPSLGVALVMALPVYAMSYIPLNHWFLLPLQIVVGAIITIFICEKFKLPEYHEIKGITLPIINKIFKRQ